MATANWIGTDTTTSGSWPGVYGSEGFFIYGGNSVNPSYLSPPSYAAVSVTTWSQNSQWSYPTTDPRALPISTVPGANRFAGLIWSTSTLVVNVNITDGKTHRVSLYALDWSNYGWSTQYQIIDHANQAVLDTRALSSLAQGEYGTWAISGNVDIVSSHPSGAAAPASILSGIFFDPSPKDPVTVTITSTSNPSVVGQTVWLTATVRNVTGHNSPTGTVTFYDGTTIIGTGTLS